jgi:hypothetical protein
VGASQHVTLRQETGAAVNASQGAPDVVVSELGTSANGNAIQMVAGNGELPPLDPTWTVAENHPLTRDLNWMGLLTPRPLELTLTENDEPLLWKGDRLLALLRHERGEDGSTTRRLLLGWDISQSNAARHPAMLVLMHRFIESVRERKREAWAGNFETGQAIEFSHAGPHAIGVPKPDAAPVKLTLRAEGIDNEEFSGQVPERVGFFEVMEQAKPLLRGAAYFADTRESDFRTAGPVDTVEQRRWEAAMKQTEADPWMPLWMLVLLGCLIVAWTWRSGMHRGTDRNSPTMPGTLVSPAS